MHASARSLVAMSLIIPLLVAGSVHADPAGRSRKKARSTSLTVAVAKANQKYLKNRPVLDTKTIDESGIFEGRFKVAPSIVRREAHDDGSETLHCEFNVDSGSPERFKTLEERQSLADAVRLVKRAKDDRLRAEELFRQDWARRRFRGKGIFAGKRIWGWFNRKTGQRITDAQFEQLLKEALRDAEDDVINAERNLIAVSQPINKRLEEAKAEADRVRATIHVKSKYAQRINWPKLMHGTSTIVVSVESYGSRHYGEGEEAEHLISDVTLHLVDVSKRYKIRPAGEKSQMAKSDADKRGASSNAEKDEQS
ncbi:MAG: hypothetical protein H6819_03655 [Phycisphaerales bacterium]|nr:hypothetical protein [Phycisphaerales bacterium]MCB9856293.1 hypothetical protein [Phycisphaerales bacterium]MCB9863268.1 hypothetical protein [Phycisphaerales bacterium]